MHRQERYDERMVEKWTADKRERVNSACCAMVPILGSNMAIEKREKQSVLNTYNKKEAVHWQRGFESDRNRDRGRKREGEPSSEAWDTENRKESRREKKKTKRRIAAMLLHVS